MTLADSLTPKDTEEIKPNLFIQRRGNEYKQVYPVAWKGEMRWKEQLKTIFSFRTLMTLVIILFIAWAYTNDVEEYKNFYVEVKNNPIAYCENIYNTQNGVQNSYPLSGYIETSS